MFHSSQSYFEVNLDETTMIKADSFQDIIFLKCHNWHINSDAAGTFLLWLISLFLKNIKGKNPDFL